MNYYDIIVIGAGASGMTAALTAARLGCHVLLLEHKEKIGKKLSATGNGKCNYTNRRQEIECYRSQNADMAWNIVQKFNVRSTIDFFRHMGILPLEKNGYFYPNSEQASSVVDAFRTELEYKKVKVHCNEHVVKIEKHEDFHVLTKGYCYHGRSVILSTGGCASQSLGSDGSGYLLAKEFGHQIISALPALTALESAHNCLKVMAGVRARAAITLFIDNGKSNSEEGEIQFNKTGISGIPVLQISRFASQALFLEKRVEVEIDFLPALCTEQVQKELESRIYNCPYKTIRQMLNGMLNNKLADGILLKAGIDRGEKQTDKKLLVRLADEIKHFRLPIQKTGDFSKAQVTAGGVPVTEIDPDSMESQKQKGLYLTGELLDVDGTCGGYNLQWAWTTGYLAGKAAAKEAGDII